MSFISGNMSDNLFAAVLNERNSFKMVYNRSFGYNKLATIASILNINTGGTRIDTYNGKYEYAWDDRNEVISMIRTATAVGNNILLQFYDSAYDAFRLKDQVMDSEQNKGRVIDKSPGQILIEPTGYTFNTATMFTANQYCKVLKDLSGIRDSRGKSNLFSLPQTDFNYVATTRDSVGLSRKDKISTLVMNGKEYWWSKAEDDMVARIANGDERTLLFGERTQYESSLEGLVNDSGGLDWSIKNRGGIYKPLTSVITRSQFHDILLEHSVRSTSSDSVVIVMGKAMLMHMQETFTSDFIKYVGRNNTFGGETVKGLNVMQYAIGGIVYNFLLLPCLDDKKYFPETSLIPGVRGTRMSNRIYILDLAPLRVQGGEGTLPAIERLYWGEEGPLYRVIPGMVGANGNSTGGNTVGKYQMTGSDRDGYTCEYLQDQGWNIPIADRMVLVEYIR